MIIIAGHMIARDPDQRDPAVMGFYKLIAAARKADGCLDFSISADPVEPDRVNLFECWRDQPALNAWRKIAGKFAVLPKLDASEIQIKLYRSDKAEKPF